jgi:hypothetical protein
MDTYRLLINTNNGIVIKVTYLSSVTQGRPQYPASIKGQ